MRLRLGVYHDLGSSRMKVKSRSVGYILEARNNNKCQELDVNKQATPLYTYCIYQV